MNKLDHFDGLRKYTHQLPLSKLSGVYSTDVENDPLPVYAFNVRIAGPIQTKMNGQLTRGIYCTHDPQLEEEIKMEVLQLDGMKRIGGAIENFGRLFKSSKVLG